MDLASIIFANSTDAGDDAECIAKLDNNVACFCVTDMNIVFASIEFVAFTICIASFFLVRHQKNQKIDCKQIVLCLLFALAFIVHYGFVLFTFMGPNNCRKIRRITSYICFTPQAIFFIVFIWVIFKLLVIWRLMVSETKVQQEKERKRLKIIQLCYLSVWVVFWFI